MAKPKSSRQQQCNAKAGSHVGYNSSYCMWRGVLLALVASRGDPEHPRAAPAPPREAIAWRTAAIRCVGRLLRCMARWLAGWKALLPRAPPAAAPPAKLREAEKDSASENQRREPITRLYSMHSIGGSYISIAAWALGSQHHEALPNAIIRPSHGLTSSTSLSSAVHPRRRLQKSKTVLFESDISVSEDDALFLERFRRRRQISKYRATARVQLLPPSPQFSETEFVRAVLESLRNDENVYNKFQDIDKSESVQSVPVDSGAYVLLRSSTAEWFDTIRRFVGVVPYSCTDMGDDEYVHEVASAVASSFARSNNQFHILTGQDPAPKYVATFPTDPVGHDDTTSWLECRLRDATTDELLVVSGWDLKRRESDGAWLIDGLDWQDFRDGFRPGIGREEWERICG